MTLRQIFTQNLREIRRAAGLSQMRLAERCNTATNYINEIERGNKFPSVEMLEKIANALQVPPYLLFFNFAEKQKPAEDAPLIAPKIKGDLFQQLSAAAQKILQQY
ncbi:helix-turn-helix XRE-family transcriptional regulators [Candidatus Termititenax aidoneus]|uniref:Helix-turn-helix XRE-family transcriptional regulators n=1 Tax=Termititenax aidoneus TaxID=2218524 RepID=A0A388TE60_TERA1|nr:helix-turn-helix XRE-family transcriptional regulators [Candidatus Termititenax aidoneus]